MSEEKVSKSKQFNIQQYLANLGNELVLAFDNASLVTTPGNTGRAREQAVLKKLNALLPAGIGIGSGFVTDHEGNTSKQMDIVLYERELCPVFTFNEDEETSYYPCEGVIAVGEVKSNIGTTELDDILEKVASAKRLIRWCQATDDGLGAPSISYRLYGSTVSFAGSSKNPYDQQSNSRDQIWGFAIAGSVKTSTPTMLTRLNEFQEKNGPAICPNRIVTMSGTCASPCLFKNRWHVIPSAVVLGTQTGHIAVRVPHPLAYLVREITKMFTAGCTVDTTAFLQYIPTPTSFEVAGKEPDKRSGFVIAK